MTKPKSAKATKPAIRDNNGYFGHYKILSETDKMHIQNLCEISAQNFGIDVDQVFLRPRQKAPNYVAMCRYVAWTGCVSVMKLGGQTQIARYTGDYHHATLCHGLKKVCDEIEIPYLERDIKPAMECIIDYHNSFNNSNLNYETWKQQFLESMKK